MAAASPPPTRQLFVRFPSRLPRDSREDVITLIRGELSRFGPIQFIDPVQEKRVVYVLMSTEGDAIRIVQELQGHVSSNDWKWEIEFHRV